MNKFLLASAWMPVFETNDLDAYVPELWANESLMILEANTVMANLVHRDFEDEVQNFGDVVNTRAPASYTYKRKTNADDVTVQNSEATNVPIKLNHHGHVSFRIRDGEESKGFKNLVEENLVPAMVAMAQGIDESIIGSMYSFLGTASLNSTVGKLGTDPTRSTLTALRDVMNTNKVPAIGRNLVLSSPMEAALLNVDNLITADKVGDEGSKLREGSLGKVYGIQTFMDQNVPSIATGNTTTSTTIDEADGYAKGSTALTVDGGTNVTAGSWCTISGDNTPQKIVSVTGTPATEITIYPGLRYAIEDDAVVTVYSPGAVDEASDYAEGYSKELTVDGFTVAPKTGQLISFGAAGALANYGAMSDPTTTEILLNNALGAGISNNDVVGIGPAGNYGFAFHKNAVSFVSRPLALPTEGTGARAAVVNYNGLSIRVTITYSGEKQGHLVTLDLLAGVKVLDARLGAVVLG